MRVDILEPDIDLNKAIDTLGRVLGPMLGKAWENKRKAYDDKPFNLNVNVFTQLWINKDMKIFVAYDDNNNNNVVGFLTGTAYRPMQYSARVFQIQDWYTGNRPEVEKALFSFLSEAVKFLGTDEILISNTEGEGIPNIPGNWKEETVITTRRFVKVQ